jgi:hypothetical protein
MNKESPILTDATFISVVPSSLSYFSLLVLCPRMYDPYLLKPLGILNHPCTFWIFAILEALDDQHCFARLTPDGGSEAGRYSSLPLVPGNSIIHLAQPSTRYTLI